MATMEELLKAAHISIAGLEAVQKLHSKKIDALWSTIQQQDKLIKFLMDVEEDLRKDSLKLHDVYYKVFPEKVAEDIAKLDAQEAPEEAAPAGDAAP